MSNELRRNAGVEEGRYFTNVTFNRGKKVKSLLELL